MIQSFYDLFKSLKESFDFTRPVYSKDLYMDGKKLNFIDYNETYIKNKNMSPLERYYIQVQENKQFKVMNDDMKKDKFVNKEESYKSFLEKESTNYTPKEVKQQPEINKYCLDIASKLPNTCLKELFDNANKIKEYLEGK